MGQDQPQDGAGAGGPQGRAGAAGRGRGGVRPLRRRRVEGGGRRHQVNVRFTRQELDQVVLRAAATGRTISTYVAEAALSAAPGPRAGAAPGPQDRVPLVFRVSDSERRAWVAELMAVRRIVGANANNLNQLAKVANATGQLPPELPPSLTATLHAAERLTDLIDALAGDDDQT
jgi:hypothetical protein